MSMKKLNKNMMIMGGTAVGMGVTNTVLNEMPNTGSLSNAIGKGSGMMGVAMTGMFANEAIGSLNNISTKHNKKMFKY